MLKFKLKFQLSWIIVKMLKFKLNFQFFIIVMDKCKNVKI
jgi:hypothetical protein